MSIFCAIGFLIFWIGLLVYLVAYGANRVNQTRDHIVDAIIKSMGVDEDKEN
jgi:hypothetical protein